MQNKGEEYSCVFLEGGKFCGSLQWPSWQWPTVMELGGLSYRMPVELQCSAGCLTATLVAP